MDKLLWIQENLPEWCDVLIRTNNVKDKPLDKNCTDPQEQWFVNVIISPNPVLNNKFKLYYGCYMDSLEGALDKAIAKIKEIKEEGVKDES